MITALYPRVSTQEQALHGYSIAEQIERMESYCKAMGWRDRKVYTDAGFSGASLDRPALRQLIQDVQAGSVDRVRALQDTRAKLVARVEQIKNSPTGVSGEAAKEIIDNLEKVAHNGDFDAIRGMLTALIDHIELIEDDVTIFWRFSSPL